MFSNKLSLEEEEAVGLKAQEYFVENARFGFSAILKIIWSGFFLDILPMTCCPTVRTCFDFFQDLLLSLKSTSRKGHAEFAIVK